MPESVKVGDLVHCNQDYPFIHGLKLEDRVGVVFEVRRDHCRVFYDSLGQSFWLPIEYLTTLSDGSPIESCLLRKLNLLLNLVRASECEVEIKPAGNYKLNASIETFDYRLFEELKARLKDDFIDLAIYPLGMTTMLLEIKFQ